MLIEEPYFSLKIRPGLSPEQWNGVASALIRIAIDPPRSQIELRRVAVRTALAQYAGSRYARAGKLAAQFQTYIAGPWKREKALEALPEPRSTERVLLHRLARLNEGRPLGKRQLDRIAGSVTFERS
jgi:hypothetical protein